MRFWWRSIKVHGWLAVAFALNFPHTHCILTHMQTCFYAQWGLQMQMTATGREGDACQMLCLQTKWRWQVESLKKQWSQKKVTLRKRWRQPFDHPCAAEREEEANTVLVVLFLGRSRVGLTGSWLRCSFQMPILAFSSQQQVYAVSQALWQLQKLFTEKLGLCGVVSTYL